eukprot:6823754-Karenia_brevis.AAC.1
MYVDTLRNACRHALNVRNAATDEDRQWYIDNETHKVIVATGPGGVGKTAATFFTIDEVLEEGGYVLFAVYTG